MDIYVISRKSPKDQSLGNYAAMCTANAVSTDQLVADMVAESSVTRHDVVGVLNALRDQIRQNVILGKSTGVGDLGLFYYTLKGKKQETAADVAASNITGVHVRFRASTALRQYLQPGSGNIRFVLRADKDHTPLKKTTANP